MNATKKILAVMLVMIIISGLASGTTLLTHGEWRAGLYFTFVLYGAIGLLFLIGAIIKLLDYVFE